MTFVYPLLPGAMSSHAAVYGALTKGDGGIQDIGDPWWTGKPTTTDVGNADFDGGFTTKQAQQPEAVPGQRYDWGDWQSYPRDDAGFQWETESLVFPITFQ